MKKHHTNKSVKLIKLILRTPENVKPYQNTYNTEDTDPETTMGPPRPPGPPGDLGGVFQSIQIHSKHT